VPFKIWMAAPILEGPIANMIAIFQIPNIRYILPLILGVHLMCYEVASVMSQQCD